MVGGHARSGAAWGIPAPGRVRSGGTRGVPEAARLAPADVRNGSAGESGVPAGARWGPAKVNHAPGRARRTPAVVRWLPVMGSRFPEVASGLPAHVNCESAAAAAEDLFEESRATGAKDAKGITATAVWMGKIRFTQSHKGHEGDWACQGDFPAVITLRALRVKRLLPLFSLSRASSFAPFATVA